jgi:hypothetical protein
MRPTPGLPPLRDGELHEVSVEIAKAEEQRGRPVGNDIDILTSEPLNGRTAGVKAKPGHAEILVHVDRTARKSIDPVGQPNQTSGLCHLRRRLGGDASLPCLRGGDQPPLLCPDFGQLP